LTAAIQCVKTRCRAFDITGRPMRNWVAVEPDGVEDDDQLNGWIDLALKFVKALPAKEK
jgi:hypothetical protein